jgi:hypothetical protein
MWTIYGKDGKEDLTYRLFHVYFSAKRAYNKGVVSVPQEETSWESRTPTHSLAMNAVVGRVRYEVKERFADSPSFQPVKRYKTAQEISVINLQRDGEFASELDRNNNFQAIESFPVSTPASFSWSRPITSNVNDKNSPMILADTERLVVSPNDISRHHNQFLSHQCEYIKQIPDSNIRGSSFARSPIFRSSSDANASLTMNTNFTQINHSSGAADYSGSLGILLCSSIGSFSFSDSDYDDENGDTFHTPVRSFASSFDTNCSKLNESSPTIRAEAFAARLDAVNKGVWNEIRTIPEGERPYLYDKLISWARHLVNNPIGDANTADYFESSSTRRTSQHEIMESYKDPLQCSPEIDVGESFLELDGDSSEFQQFCHDFLEQANGSWDEHTEFSEYS